MQSYEKSFIYSKYLAEMLWSHIYKICNAHKMSVDMKNLYANKFTILWHVLKIEHFRN